MAWDKAQLPLPASAQRFPPPSRSNQAVGVSKFGEHGSVYTRPWAVHLILDLAGYDVSRNLVDAVTVEPSCGTGEFLEPMIQRLVASCQRQGRPLQDCADSLRAFDINSDAVAVSIERAESVLLGC